jgi:hypothetical protein
MLDVAGGRDSEGSRSHGHEASCSDSESRTRGYAQAPATKMGELELEAENLSEARTPTLKSTTRSRSSQCVQCKGRIPTRSPVPDYPGPSPRPALLLLLDDATVQPYFSGTGIH